MLGCNIRGRCWWYGSRGWTFPPILLLHFGATWQMAADGESHIKAHMKQRCITEFFHEEKTSPTDILWCLLNADGGQGAGGSTVQQCVVCESSGKRDMKDKLCYGWRSCKRGMQALAHYQKKCTANGGDCIEKQCFVAKKLLYQIALLCSFSLL